MKNQLPFTDESKQNEFLIDKLIKKQFIFVQVRLLDHNVRTHGIDSYYQNMLFRTRVQNKKCKEIFLSSSYGLIQLSILLTCFMP